MKSDSLTETTDRKPTKAQLRAIYLHAAEMIDDRRHEFCCCAIAEAALEAGGFPMRETRPSSDSPEARPFVEPFRAAFRRGSVAETRFPDAIDHTPPFWGSTREVDQAQRVLALLLLRETLR